MKVKFVYDGQAPRDDHGKEVSIDMKALPHAGDRLRMADGAMVEILAVTHTPDEKECAAIAMVAPVVL